MGVICRCDIDSTYVLIEEELRHLGSRSASWVVGVVTCIEPHRDDVTLNNHKSEHETTYDFLMQVTEGWLKEASMAGLSRIEHPTQHKALLFSE